MQRLHFVFLMSLVLFSIFNVFSQNTRKYSNAFMTIGVGAKALGMGNSVAANVDDVTSVYWNPAGLTKQEDKIQIGFMHSAYMMSVANYDYLGLSAKVDEKTTIGAGMIRFGVDGIPNTINLFRNGQLDYNQITEFSAVDYGFLFSYAKRLKIEGLSIGGSAKIIHRKGGEFATAWGFGIDVGLQYKSKNDWNFAVMGRDITSTFNAWSFDLSEDEKLVFAQTGNEIPRNSLEITLPSFILGVNKKVNITNEITLLSEFNIDFTTDGRRNNLIQTNLISGEPRLGIEGGYDDIVFIRAGIGNTQQVLKADSEGDKSWVVQPNIGVGLKLKQFSLDYALSALGNNSIANYSNVFSIRFSINPKD